MKTLAQRATEVLRKLETRGSTIDLSGLAELLREVAEKPAKGSGVPDDWRQELLDWVSACQSAYHIDSTPGHRFGGIGSNLEENRASVIEYVEELLAAAPKAPSVVAKRLAWIRLCSDGGYEGPIADCDRRMDDARRESGAWTPLYAITPDSLASQINDAERYRWLRDAVGEHWEAAVHTLVGVGSPADVDAAIDAAIAAEKGGEA